MASRGFALVSSAKRTLVWGGLSLTGYYTDGLICIEAGTNGTARCERFKSFNVRYFELPAHVLSTFASIVKGERLLIRARRSAIGCEQKRVLDSMEVFEYFHGPGSDRSGGIYVPVQKSALLLLMDEMGEVTSWITKNRGTMLQRG